MGWKLFMDTFEISHHVQVTSAGLCIGSSYVHDLVVICLRTGKIMKDGFSYSDFLSQYYPRIKDLSNEERLEIIKKDDVFKTSVQVFTFKKDKIITRTAEKHGQHRVTHDGVMMYENTFFKTSDEAIVAAIEECDSENKWLIRNIDEAEISLKKLRDDLNDCINIKDSLNKKKPPY